MWILLYLLIALVDCQLHINNLIVSTVVPPGETTRKDRTDTIYDEPVGIFTDVSEKLTPQDIEEFFDRDRRRKWNSAKTRNPNSSWKATTEEPTYKTDEAVIKNDPIEFEFSQMPGRAKVFHEDSGLPLAMTTHPMIHPISSETEITMSMSTLPDKSAPEMAAKLLELKSLSPLPLVINGLANDDEDTRTAITLPPRKRPDPYSTIPVESSLDMAVIPRLHNDVQRLIEEVSTLKELVNKLVQLHTKERREKKMVKKRRNSRKVTGTSVVSPGNRLTATQTQDQASTDHFIHTWKDIPRKGKTVLYGIH